jgi:hypothetical protein
MQGSQRSLAAPMLSRVARAADTLKIGMVLPLSGPAAAVGRYALAGAKIALDRVNKSGGVLGKQLELVTEDDQTTNPGAMLAFSKLAAQPDIIAFLGPVRSTQNRAIANDILKAAKPFCFGGTDPALTKMGNPWMIRFRPNDSYSGRVIDAAFGVLPDHLGLVGVVMTSQLAIQLAMRLLRLFMRPPYAALVPGLVPRSLSLAAVIASCTSASTSLMKAIAIALSIRK